MLTLHRTVSSPSIYPPRGIEGVKKIVCLMGFEMDWAGEEALYEGGGGRGVRKTLIYDTDNKDIIGSRR